MTIKEYFTPWWISYFARSISCKSTPVVAQTQPRKRASQVVKVWVQKLDLFGFSPIIQFDSFKTFFGGFSSLLCLAGIVIYMIVTANRFLNEPISKSQLVTRMDEKGVRSFQFGFQFTDSLGQPVNDPSYFTFTASVVEIRNSNASNKIFTPLPISSCIFYTNISDDGIKGSESAVNIPCVTEEDITSVLPKLIGLFEDPLYLYIDVALVGCISGGNVICQSSSDIDDLIVGGSFSIMWYNTAVRDLIGVDPNFKKLKVWRSYRFKYVSGVENSYDIYFTKSIITHTSAWPLGKDDVEESNNEHNIISTNSKFSQSKRRYHHAYLRTGYYMTREQWSPQNFFDLLGSWGAFWSTLLLFFGTGALLYNSTKWHYLLRYESVVDESGTVRHAKNRDTILYEPGESEELQLLTKRIPKLTSDAVKVAFKA